MLNIDEKSNHALPSDTVESLQVILKKYGFIFSLEKDSLNLCIKYEEDNGYEGRNESKWKSIPIFDAIKI